MENFEHSSGWIFRKPEDNNGMSRVRGGFSKHRRRFPFGGHYLQNMWPSPSWPHHWHSRWMDPVFDNESIATNYPASCLTAVAAHGTVSEYPASNYSKKEYSNSDHAEMIIMVMLIETRTTQKMITGLQSEAAPARKPLTILGHHQ